MDTFVGVELGKSSFRGHSVSRIITPGRALRTLKGSEGPVEMLAQAMRAPYRDVIMDDRQDEFLVWSARTVTVLPVVCSVEHDGGFFETV